MSIPVGVVAEVNRATAESWVDQANGQVAMLLLSVAIAHTDDGYGLIVLPSSVGQSPAAMIATLRVAITMIEEAM